MFKRFTYHRDPGHGWLEVTPSDVFEVGLTASSFSDYSYALPNNAGEASLFLEEDMDMMTFCRAFERKHKHLPVMSVIDYPNDAPIRDYWRLQTFFKKAEVA